MKGFHILRIPLLLITLCPLLQACANTAPADNTYIVELQGGSITINEPDIPTIDSIDVFSQIPLEPVEPELEEYDIHLMALGDNLIHMGVIYSGKKDDGTFDFSFLFNGITEFIDTADIRVINQETIMAGNHLGFSGYPHFNSPTEVGDAIANAGFQVVLQATNHAADQTISGIDSCISFWETHPEVMLAGIHSPDSTSNDIQLLTVKDKTFAILNYTYGPNYGLAPVELAKRLDILCAYDEQSRVIDFTQLNPQVLADIEKADELADMVLVFPHWGNEYATSASSYQQDFARQMTSAGADVIIGTHPHVVQPVEFITADNGNESVCFYSLGNYVSTQKNPQSILEAMAWVSFHVTDDDISLVIEETGALPLVCHYRSNPVRIEQIYPLEAYSEELAARHGILSYGGVALHYADLLTWSQQILGEHVLTIDEILSQTK